MNEKNGSLGSGTPLGDERDSQTNNEKGTSKSRKPDRGPKWPERLTLTFTAVIAFSAVVYTTIAIMQWTVMRQSLEIVERAWVGPTDLKLIRKPTPSEDVTIDVFWTNTGRTPALNVIVRRMIHLSYEPVPQFPTPAEEFWLTGFLSKATLFPGATSKGSSSLQVSEQEVNLINQGEAWIYLFGAIDYEDVFGKRHRTQFCNVYKPGPRPFFSDCEQHNRAD